MLNTACITELESQMGQMEELFRTAEDLQQHDIPKLVNKAREWESTASWVVTIENFHRLN